MNNEISSPPPAESARPRTRRDWMYLAGAVLIPLAVLCTFRILLLTDGEASSDSLYHARIAKMGPSVFLAKEFPWLQTSIWRDSFADKELLYHGILWGIFRTEELLGIDTEPPFHSESAIFLLILCTSFAYAAWKLGLSPPMVLFASCLMPVVSPNFTFRLLMMRPHLLSLALFFLMLAVLAKTRFREKAIWTGVLSFVYAWSYSNPNFILIPVCAYAFFSMGRGRWRELFLPLISLSAVLLAMTAHPQAPHTFTIWKIQSFNALVNPMMSQVREILPAEMLAPSFGWHLNMLPLYILLALGLFFAIRSVEKCGFAVFSRSFYAVAALAGMFFLGNFAVLRGVEYAAPFGVLAALLAAQTFFRAGFLPLIRTRTALRLTVCAAVAVTLAVFSGNRAIRDGRVVEIRPISQVAAWLNENVPAGSRVVNVDWSDFPVLYYYAPGLRYQWGMDPEFSFASDPETTLLLARLSPCTAVPRATNPYLLRTRQTLDPGEKNPLYAILLWPRAGIASYLRACGWIPVAAFDEPGREEGWIYRFDP